jgi:hypothetical protein
MRTPPSEPAIRALVFLLELAARDAGYLVRGVRGWASPQDVEEALGLWGSSELLSAQVQRGRAIREDVRAPGDTRPTYVYRISQKGIDVLAEAVGTAPAGIDEPRHKPSGVWLREGVQVALDALRSVAESPDPRARVWIVGEVGWTSSPELKRILAKQDEDAGRSPGRTFLSEDLRWLVRLGYAEERIVGRNHVYRITRAGLELKVLEWREPADA